MKCLYKEIDCNQVDTAGMSQIRSCNECPAYENGVRLTGATPNLGWLLSFFRNKYKKESKKPNLIKKQYETSIL